MANSTTITNIPIFRLMLIGDSSVGKTSLFTKFCDNKFHESFMSTIGLDFKIKTIDLHGNIIRLQIWDTAGRERFQTSDNSYYRRADAVFITYDVTDCKSFEHVANWVRQIKANAPDDVCAMLVGNKTDMAKQRVVTTERGQQLASEQNMLFCETSAKTGLNVEKAFLDVAKVLFQPQLEAQAEWAKLVKSERIERRNNRNLNNRPSLQKTLKNAWRGLVRDFRKY